MSVIQSARRRLSWIVAAAVVCGVVLCVGAAVHRAPFDGAGERVVAALGDATGLKVETRGAAEISLFPTPRVRVPGVSLARPGEPPFVMARELAGSLRLWALFQGRLELSEISLDRPEIALDRAPVGDALAGLRGRAPDAARPALRLTDGRLTVAGRVIDRLEAGLVWPRDGGPLAISGYGRFAGAPVEATFQLADLTALSNGQRAPFRARIEGGGARLLFDGEAIDENGPKFSGEISARAISLGETLAWLGVGRGGDRAARVSLSLAGRGVLDAQGLAVSNAELDLSGDSFMGAGRLTATSDGRPSIEATVDAGKLDALPYVAMLAPQVLKTDGWSAAEIELGGLKGWTLDLRLSAEEVKLGRLTLGQTAATVAVGGDGLDLSIGEAEAYGGSLGGRLSLEPEGRGAKMTLEGAVTGVALDEALSALDKSPQMSGSLTGELAVVGTGSSVADLVAGLSGKASGRVTDGALERIGRSRTLALVGLGRRMDVSSADAQFRIERGVARTDDVSILGPDASFALAGAASLVDRRVHLKGSVKPAGGGWSLPVTLEGPLASPKLRPDLVDRTPRGEARSGAAPAAAPTN
ncbi:AsmA-like C-terminal region-containing protein [Methylopila sp. M107]|uniref:AsmA family protein n=1 Tax=Methylopila sp. M107 TaxID=1101190 RepID=UPI00035DF58A|nr:AsmA-like C-terminal region-containing protein [Methylopila sp. M107]